MKLNPRVVGAIGLTDEVMGGGSLSKEAIKMIAVDLTRYPEADVLRALERVRRECHGRLTTAAIFERLAGAPRVLTADEAWAVCLRKEPWDEERTCVLPRAALVAWHAAAAVYRDGDKIGARMAFKGAWPAALAEHGAEIAVSEGWNRADRTRAIEEALAEGLVTVDQVRPYGVLPAPSAETRALPGPSAVPKPEIENVISRFADVLRGRADQDKQARRDVDLAFAMEKHGRSPDHPTALKEICGMTEEQKTSLAHDLKHAELATMSSLRDRGKVEAGKSAPEPSRATR